MGKNKKGLDCDFMISSGPVPRTPSRAGDEQPTPKDHSAERNPEFEYPPSGSIGASHDDE